MTTQQLIAPAMVYITGEEMTRYTMELILAQWVHPHVDTSAWQCFDMSAKQRDATDDQVLKDAIAAGKKIGAIFKEPTVTPSAEQAKQMGLKKAWGSPNGTMRRGWDGISMSRDTIHVPGLDLGYKKPVLFDRFPVGDQYAAKGEEVGEGKAVTMFYPKDGGAPREIFTEELGAGGNMLVTYNTPLKNVPAFAHHFFARALEAGVVPYVVTKKTVFKYQECFWRMMKEIFDRDYKERFLAKGLIDYTRGELGHLLSDAATMKLVVWKQGGFAMAAMNYDGDILTDEISQVHRSPAFITSVLVGKREDGTIIKEFEASHGTVSDMEQARLRGEATSLNPLGLVQALAAAMDHSAVLAGKDRATAMSMYTGAMMAAVSETLASADATRDILGEQGVSTEQFIEAVAARIQEKLDAAGTLRKAV